MAEIPEGRFKQELSRLTETARNRALDNLARLRVPRNNVESLTVDDAGNLIYECVPPESANAAVPAPVAEATLLAASVPIALPPVRHSRPGATKIVYLDFNGHDITGTAWNLAKGTPGDAGYRPAVTTYAAKTFDTDGDPNQFNSTEQSVIVQVWARVAEDYIGFDVDVTTEEPVEFTPTTGRVLITTSIDANGVNMPSSTASGVAYLAKFGEADYVSTFSPALVYHDKLNNYVSYIAETASHEMGHNLSLTHDGTTTSEYYEGHGGGETSWGPIMGAPFYANLSQWSKGEYYNANNPQDDLAMLAGHLGYAADDHPDANGTAVALTVSSSGFSGKGMIGAGGDADRFAITVPTKALTIQAAPFIGPGTTAGGNADLALELYDAADNLIAQSTEYYPSPSATLETGVNAGTYYLRITTTGTGQPMANPPYGYTAYGSFGQFSLSGTLIDPVAPSITSQPQNRSCEAGQMVDFSFYVDGEPTPVWRWQRLPSGQSEWQDLTESATYVGTNSNILRISTTLAMHGDQFRSLATNIGGQVVSQVVRLDVRPAVPPQIYNVPALVPAEYGQSLSISPSISGTYPMTYDWRKDGQVIPGATGSSFYKNDVTTADAGSYTLTATNLGGVATCSPVTVTIGAPIAPSIYNLRTTVIIGAGNTLYLGASIAGTRPMTYQWFKDGNAIPNANFPDYSRSNTTVDDSGVYSLTATNLLGTATSIPVTVTVSPPVAPAIYGVGGIRNLAYGESLYLSATITGSPTLTYQWHKDGVPIAGATSTYYSKSLLTPADAGRYTLVATNSVGTATSAELVLTVQSARPPEIYNFTPSKTVKYGSYVSFDGSIAGSSPMSYEWKKNGVVMPGAINSSLSLSNVTSADNGTYHLTVSNAVGSAISPAVVLTVDPPVAPVIYNLPSTLVVAFGNTLGIAPSYLGTTPVIFQWWKDGAIISGATNGYFNQPNASAADAGRYRVTATNLAGSFTSNEVNVIIDEAVPPAVHGLPASLTVAYGDSLSLYGVITGSPMLYYQWKKDGENLVGGNYQSYGKSPMTAADAGSYTLTVTNSVGTFTSQPVTVTVSPAIAPGLANMPAIITAEYNGSINIYPAISGTQPMTYVWRKDGVVMDTAISSSFYKSQARPADAGVYTVTVTNVAGSATSSETTVIVNPALPPEIYNVPATFVGRYGESLSVNPSVSGTGPISYQWRKDGVAVYQGQNLSLSKNAITAADSGTYTLTATNLVGSVTSSGMVVTVLEPEAPAIYGLPGAVARNYGDSLSLSATVTGTQPMTFQWKKDGVELAGGNSQQLYRGPVTPADNGTYTLTVSNLAGTATSSAVSVVVQEAAAPAIYNFPAGLEVDYGQSISIWTTVVGTSPLTIQWRKDGVLLPNETSSYFNRSYVTTADSGDYTMTVINQVGSITSPVLHVTVRPPVPPSITGQPQSLAVSPGHTANFSINATGTSPLSYQWYGNGVAIMGATSSSLAIAEVDQAKLGSYHVVLSNPGGSITSDPAGLALDDGLAIVTAVASSGFSFWIKSDGSLWASGENYYGQLGDGSRTTRLNARMIATDVVAADAGWSHTLYLRKDGTLWAMGNNEYGQLGTGSHASEAAPVQVASGVIAVEAGYDTSFFIKSDHTLWAMGQNTDGRLGDGTLESRATPVQIATNVRKISAGSGHGLMILQDGTMWAFGQNYSGQLGDGTYSSRYTPVQIDLDVAEVSAGGEYSAYIKTDGTLWSMGRNYNGQLGDGTTTTRNSPVMIAGGVQSVSAGSNCKLYVGVDGKLWGTGDNYQGQLGDGSYNSYISPVIIADGVARAIAGTGFSLIIRTDGSLWGMGNSDYGRFGDGRSVGSRLFPFQLTWHSATAPIIADQPDSQSVTRGANVTFAVGVSSTLPYTLQWRHAGQPIEGATTATYSIMGVTDGQAGTYDVVVTYAEGTVTSSAAVLGVTDSFGSWAQTHFNAGELSDASVSGPQGDPDGDAYVNLVEYALGMSPRAATSTAAPEVGVDATHWIFTYSKPADRPDVAYAVEVSTDLVTWGEPDVLQELVATVDGIETWRARQPLGTATVFFRLKVTAQ